MLLAPIATLAGLLVLAGLLKARRPEAATGALHAVGLPGGALVVRLLAAGEIAAGVAALMVAQRTGALVLAGTYAVLGVVAWRLLSTAPGSPGCGCFGDLRSPVHAVHLAFDLIAAALASMGALSGGAAPSLLSAWGDQHLTVGAPLALATLAGVALSYVLLTVAPGSWGAWEGSAR